MNKKVYTVKEFDTVTNNDSYEKTDGYVVFEKKHFKELCDFVTKNNDEKPDDDAEALDFFQYSYRKNIGYNVKIKNFVGLIQLPSGCQVQVLPKIQLAKATDDTENKATIDLFMKMLACLKNFKGKQLSESNINTKKMSVFEVFIWMYVSSVSELVKKGLKSAYTQQEDNLKFYKGKMLTNQQIKYNFAHKERFYCQYDEYNLNRPENKLIKSTLLKLERITQYPDNSKMIKQLLAFFEVVEPSAPGSYEKDFAAIHFDRSNAEYEEIIEWSKVFLINKSFTSFSGDSNAIALLFPMEKLYEAYVGKYAKRVFGSDYSVYTQYKSEHLFEAPNRFLLKPDIVLKKTVDGKEQTIVMDTKWKRLINNEGKNYGISQADMYQMYAYSKKYDSPDIWLLYPQTEDLINNLPEYKEFKEADGATIHIFFLDLENIESDGNSYSGSLNHLKVLLKK